MTWTAILRGWARQYDATHAMLEGAGRRRRLAIASIPAAITREWGCPTSTITAYVTGTTVVVEHGHRKAVVYWPTVRVPDGYDMDGKPRYYHVRVDR